MSLRCGLIGLPSCGKTTIFNAITAARASMYGGSEMNRVVVNVPDERMDRLVEMYHPRKIVPATLEVIDIPGIAAEDSTRRSRLLGNIKDVEALLHVVRCFEDEGAPFGHSTIDPVRDVETLDLELVAADSVTLENKINRLEKRVRSGDKDAVREARDCEKVRATIQEGIPARKQGLSPQELASIRECNLVSLKPVVYIANIKTMADAGNRHVQALRQVTMSEGAEMITVCGKDEADISEIEPGERAVFLKELGMEQSSMERLLRAAYHKLGLLSFFTVGEDEVRSWTCLQGDKAPVAAGKIHTDMESGFIRMEVMSYTDLMELGSEAAVAKAGKQRLEGREYQVQDGDIVSVLFNKKG
ncbi:MAG: redox-regulated ATPase YchF [Chloroflexi bacterium]|nr:redox-regulated ATPase YchF [Chloroflexota bacterium]